MGDVHPTNATFRLAALTDSEVNVLRTVLRTLADEYRRRTQP